MKIHNTLTRRIEDFIPYDVSAVRLYSCGPTVYDHIHIGNLSAFIYADVLRRILQASGNSVQHVMNFTDVDDKTITRSRERYPNESPEAALKQLTDEYAAIFLKDMEAIGNDVSVVEFIHATDNIEGMRARIRELFDDGFAYVADDGVYFSIEKYKASGKVYGQLTEVTAANTSEARIANDEYDKESAHDFALWKTAKAGEPAWEFELDGRDLTGRPGWHIECSVMSTAKLGQPFDIHTGGVDLIFPHHENEIAQSTAGDGDVYAKYFFHNEHLLVDGKKMSKSLNNFFTLRDIQEKGYDPLAFRLMVLQSHYRSQSNFSWDNLEAAQNRLKTYQDMADMIHQPLAKERKMNRYAHKVNLMKALEEDMNTPMVLALLSEIASDINDTLIHEDEVERFREFLVLLDAVLGLGLSGRGDISDEQKGLIAKREQAREVKDWTTSDEIRDELANQGVALRDTDAGSIWSRS